MEYSYSSLHCQNALIVINHRLSKYQQFRKIVDLNLPSRQNSYPSTKVVTQKYKPQK